MITTFFMAHSHFILFFCLIKWLFEGLCGFTFPNMFDLFIIAMAFVSGAITVFCSFFVGVLSTMYSFLACGLFKKLLDDGAEMFPITHPDMTRFMITLNEGVELVWFAFSDMVGGEIYIKKIPSMNIMEIAKSVSASTKTKTIGIRPGEKLHEQMIGVEDAPFTYEYPNHFKILPAINNWSKDPLRINDGKLVAEDFEYTSDKNLEWMSISDLTHWIANYKKKSL